MNERNRQFEIERLEERVLLSASRVTQLPSGVYNGYEVVSRDYVCFQRGREIWRSDGTAAGTFPITSDDPFFAFTFNVSVDLFPAGNKVFLYAPENPGVVYAEELWVIDLVAGTAKWVDSFETQTASVIGQGAVLDGIFYFSAEGDENGRELWRSDGTTEGTRLAANVNRRYSSSDPTDLTPAGDALFFTARSRTDVEALFRFDPDSSTVTQLAVGTNSVDYTTINSLAPFNDKLLYMKRFGDPELWMASASNDQVTKLADVDLGANFTGFEVAGDHAYFSGRDSQHGDELWVTDGTKPGTRVLADIVPGTGSSNAAFPVVVADFVYVETLDDGFSRVNVSNNQVQDADFGLGRVQFFELAGKAYCWDYDPDSDRWTLYRSDGTAVSTRAVSPPLYTDRAQHVIGNEVLFTVYDYPLSFSVASLWKFDPASGSVSGQVFRDLNTNGLKDPDEDGLTGWRTFVDLNNDGVCNTKEPQVRTSSTGFYRIDDLPAGKYTVRATRVAGYAATTNESFRVMVEALGNVTKRFGFAPAGTVRGYVYNDLNQNGVQNAGEPGVKDFRVWIDLDNDGVLDDSEPTAKTNSAGRYTIADVLPGDYRIRLKPKGGWISTTNKAFSFTLSAGTTSSKKFGVVLI